jgi:hypothetical protein
MRAVSSSTNAAVEQQDARGLERSHQQAHGLTLSAGQQAHAIRKPVLQPEIQRTQLGAEQFAQVSVEGKRHPAAFAAPPRKRHVLLDRQRFAGAGHRILEHARDQIRALPRGLARDVLAVDFDAAAIDAQVAADRVQKGRLAGAVGADDGDELPGRNLQAQPAQRAVFDRRAGVECDFEVLCAQHQRASL